MPIEIRELVIRTQVGAADDDGPAPRQPVLGGDGSTVVPQDIQAIVQECVRQVMRVLARERER